MSIIKVNFVVRPKMAHSFEWYWCFVRVGLRWHDIRFIGRPVVISRYQSGTSVLSRVISRQALIVGGTSETSPIHASGSSCRGCNISYNDDDGQLHDNATAVIAKGCCQCTGDYWDIISSSSINWNWNTITADHWHFDPSSSNNG